MLRPEPLDIVIIALIALLLFGANRLPETARAIGKSIREFKAGIASQEEAKPAEPKLAEQTTVPCKNCSMPIPLGTKFCFECGTAQ